MPQRPPLAWADGEGWIVLVGGGDRRHGEVDEITAHILSRVNLDRPILVLLAEGSETEAAEILDHYTASGGPGGYTLVLESVEDERLHRPDFLDLIAEAGLLHLEGDPVRLTQALRRSPALGRIVAAFATMQGLTLVGFGGGARALGAWAGSPARDTLSDRGLNFVHQTLIVPHFTGTEAHPDLRTLLAHHPQALGLGLPDGSALALGPRGEVESWGEAAITAVVKMPNEE